MIGGQNFPRITRDASCICVSRY